MVKLTLLLLVLLFSPLGHAQDHVAPWKADIDYYAEKLVEEHMDPFHTLSKSNFDEEVLRIKESIPHKNENEILVDLMRLTRKIGDGHTSFPLWGQQQVYFPLQLTLIDKRIYVVSTTAQNQGILGAELISINGVPALEVLSKLSEISPFSENKYSTSVRVASYLPNANILNGLGIVRDQAETKFVFELQGATIELDLRPSINPNLAAQISHFDDSVFTAHKKVSDDLWYGSSLDNKTIYIKFRRYTSITQMERFAQHLLAFINEKQTENLIVDLRDNYGGDFFVGLKLAQFLVLADSINWKSGVYTLIDNVTFSAAMSNAAQFSQILNSKLVGSPTGATPSGYQDMGQFTLPNSNLEVTYSKRLYHFTQGQRDALYPDVDINVSIEDYVKGYDRQLRWVLSDINKHGAH